MAANPTPTRAAIEAVWRIESARLIGGLVRFAGDLDRAEDLAQEALLSALERWPEMGIPQNPGAWLMAAARNRAIDEARRRAMVDHKHRVWEQAESTSASQTGESSEAIRDDVLRLVLTACHPVLPRESRVALTLRLVAGLTTTEIARAFLASEATMAQRLVRAKRTLTEARVPFELPVGAELHTRIPPALEVVYLIFNEGYAASSGEDWIRPALCNEAMRLGRMLVALVPGEAEAHGLLALMEIQASRMRARVGPRGEPVLLMDQDRSRWDRLLITRGLAALARAESLQRPLGPYALQAALAACHARATTPQETDWERIVALYDALAALTGSPVVELNRAVAISMLDGPAVALELVEELAAESALRDYPSLPAVRGDLLFKLGRRGEARGEFERAARLAGNRVEREQLLARAAACDELQS